jgi:hypothetical protein
MKTIYKYELTITNEQVIKIPVDAEILSVQVQHEKPCLWALVDTDNLDKNIKIHMFGTGHPLPNMELKYLGTFQMRHGHLIFHCFYENN